MPSSRPIVGVSTVLDGDTSFNHHTIGAKYVSAVAEAAHCQPLLIPNLSLSETIETLVRTLDGLFLTGGASNIEPRHYGLDDRHDVGMRDPARDALLLPLIRAMIREGKPILAVCRGIQEINVALGGTLYPFLWEQSGRIDHRSDKLLDVSARYEPSHSVHLAKTGRLATLLDNTERIVVNSLHGQAIDRLADGLCVEGTAPDGTIEAVSGQNPDAFLFAVQWHAEYQVNEIWHHRRLFEAFGAACQKEARAT